MFARILVRQPISQNQGMIPVSAFFLVMVLAISYYLLNSTCVTIIVALRPKTYPFRDRASLFSYKNQALA